MKWLKILLVLICVAVVTVVAIHRSRGHGELVVLDVIQPIEKGIKAPFMPFRNGALFVTVQGELDGDATLQIVSNHGRDRRTEVLSGSIRTKNIGDAEEWVDDLVVRFEPGSAKHGHVRMLMACGRNPKKIK